MEVNKNEDELVLKIKKNEDLYLYNHFNEFIDLRKYLMYLIDLQHNLAGTEGVCLGYEVLDYYKYDVKKMDENKKLKEFDKLLDEIIVYIKNIGEAVDYRNSFYDPVGLRCIPEDSLIDYLEIITERMGYLKKVIKEEIFKRNKKVWE